MDELKEKLKNSTLTRAELNAAQPSDESTIEWKAWNNLRIAMNDMTADLAVQALKLANDLNDRLVAIETNHVAHLEADLDAMTDIVEVLKSEVLELQQWHKQRQKD